MKRVISASLLLVLMMLEYGAGQGRVRPVNPLPDNQQQRVTGDGVRLTQSGQPVGSGGIDRERHKEILLEAWEAGKPRPQSDQAASTGNSQHMSFQERQPQSERPTENTSTIKYPPPGANKPNTTAENYLSDDEGVLPDDDNTGGDADSALVINAQLRQFALTLLTKQVIASPKTNIILCPFSVWSVMLGILEGAGGKTAQEIKTTLGLPLSMSKIRKNYKKLDSALQISGNAVVFDNANALFTDINRPPLPKYSIRLVSTYHSSIIPLNFTNPSKSVNEVNQWVSDKTNRRITQLIQREDITNPALIVANAIYFKGKWKIPFNYSATYRDKFYNEQREEIGDVQMMYQNGAYLYSFIAEINAHVLDMPYTGNKFRMLIILPKQTTTLQRVLESMKLFPVDACYDRLVHEQATYAEDNVHVYIPKFKFKNKHELAGILHTMGIRDLFDQSRANLTGINAQNDIYLGKVLQAAEVEVTEEGTVASAASGGAFVNKLGPPKFLANRPFGFFIVEATERTVIFAGRVYNPNSPV